ncbi:hypothetical protein ACFL1N_09475 [Thermodesulfobacteriota bacterium]
MINVDKKILDYLFLNLKVLFLFIISLFLFSACSMMAAHMERKAIEDYRKKPAIQIGNLKLRSNVGNFGSGKYYDLLFIEKVINSSNSVNTIEWLKKEGGESNYEDILDQIQQSLAQGTGSIMIEQSDKEDNSILLSNSAYYVDDKDDIIAFAARLNGKKEDYAYHKKYEKLEFYSIARGTKYKSLDGEKTFPKP